MRRKPGQLVPLERNGGGYGRIWGGATTMLQLAALLSRQLNRVVVDQTNVVGTFDFELTWTPDQTPFLQLPGAPIQSPVDPNGPSIFAALPEQLGLKLEAAKGPVEILVIDQAEHPTPD